MNKFNARKFLRLCIVVRSFPTLMSGSGGLLGLRFWGLLLKIQVYQSQCFLFDTSVSRSFEELSSGHSCIETVLNENIQYRAFFINRSSIKKLSSHLLWCKLYPNVRRMGHSGIFENGHWRKL